jgi:hypothetical protein
MALKFTSSGPRHCFVIIWPSFYYCFRVSMVTMLFVKYLYHFRSLVVISEQHMRLILLKKRKCLSSVLLFHITMIINTCYLENGIKVKDYSRPWPLTYRLLSHQHGNILGTQICFQLTETDTIIQKALSEQSYVIWSQTLFYFYLGFILLLFPSFDGNNVVRQMSISF